MSDYPYRTYSPSGNNRSPTRRSVIPPAGTTPVGARYGDGFEGWYDGPPQVPYGSQNFSPSLSGSNPLLSQQQPPLPPYHNIPESLQPARGSFSSASVHSAGSRRDPDRDLDLAFGAEPTGKRGSYYSTGTPGRDRDYQRRIRTPSTSSAESIGRSRDRKPSRQDRTPSISPSRPVSDLARGTGTQRTPSGNIMNNIFTAENAAAVGSALGTAANFLGSRTGIIKPEIQDTDDEDRATPGGFNSRPVPDTANNNAGFNLGNAMDYLQTFTQNQTPQPTPPAQPVVGSPFTLSNALNYLQSQQGQTTTTGTGPGQKFQLAGIDIDLGWIMQKAGEQNPWVLVGGAVVSFWIISSIIATLMWYAIVAGIFYVVYLVAVKNSGGIGGIGGTPERRRVGAGAGGGGLSSGRAGLGAGGLRRKY